MHRHTPGLYTGCGIQTQMLCWLCKHFTNYAHLSLNCVKDFNRAFTVSEDLCFQRGAPDPDADADAATKPLALRSRSSVSHCCLLLPFSIFRYCFSLWRLHNPRTFQRKAFTVSPAGSGGGKHPRADFDWSIWSNMLISEPITSGSGYTVHPHWVIRDRFHPQVSGRVSLD